MLTNKKIKFVAAVFIICLFIVSSGCSNKMYSYYSDTENYVEVTGKISFINFNENERFLYLAFDDLSYVFNDTCFKITEKNFDIVDAKNIKSKIDIGTIVNIITAPKYFGDGYVFPIVSISIEDECYLEFDVGVSNLLETL